MQVILLEKVGKLGAIGDIVNVRPGFARNYLLPQQKALRATDDNKALFEKQRAEIEKANADKRDAASKEAKKIEGKTFPMIRQASEGGQLYGSVASRDISELLREETGVDVRRNMVDLNQNIKTLGLFKIDIILHPEVICEITLNIARSMDEAAIQLKTGKAMIATMEQEEEPVKEESEMKAEAAAAEAEAQAAEESEEKEENAA